jgi:hypothetical protein
VHTSSRSVGANCANCVHSSPHRGTLLTSAAVLPAGMYVLLQVENMLDMMNLTSGLPTSGYRRVSSGQASSRLVGANNANCVHALQSQHTVMVS